MRCDIGRSTRAAALVALLLLTGLISACGHATSPSSAGAVRSSTPRILTGGTMPTSTATVGDASAHTAAGPVTITLAKSHFGSQDPLLATIHNGLKASIWIEYHQSGCTPLAVEVLDGGTWNAVGLCTLPGPAKIVEIPAGSVSAQYVSYPQEIDTGAGWAPGTYRVTLTFALSASGVGSSTASMAYSTNFTIG